MNRNMARNLHRIEGSEKSQSRFLKKLGSGALCGMTLSFVSCMPPTPRNLSVPSLEYSNRIKRQEVQEQQDYRASLSRNSAIHNAHYAPSVRFASGELPVDGQQPAPTNEALEPGVVTNLNGQTHGSFSVQESTRPNIRDYTGPLNYGEPGVSSSLWRENRALNLVRDVRAFQPMDLITIVVQETAEGKREADTDVKQSSSISASISSLLGIDDTIIKKNPQILSGDNTTLQDILGAEFNSDFKGEGETTRKGSLKGRISAMVVEVLPSGILRVEGEKILAVNNEDEVMVISGLIRPEDVNSANEVSSSKLANMRIDYFGQGTVGDAQVGGWASRILRRLWPF